MRGISATAQRPALVVVLVSLTFSAFAGVSAVPASGDTQADLLRDGSRVVTETGQGDVAGIATEATALASNAAANAQNDADEAGGPLIILEDNLEVLRDPAGAAYAKCFREPPKPCAGSTAANCHDAGHCYMGYEDFASNNPSKLFWAACIPGMSFEGHNCGWAGGATLNDETGQGARNREVPPYVRPRESVYLNEVVAYSKTGGETGRSSGAQSYFTQICDSKNPDRTANNLNDRINCGKKETFAKVLAHSIRDPRTYWMLAGSTVGGLCRSGFDPVPGQVIAKTTGWDESLRRYPIDWNNVGVFDSCDAVNRMYWTEKRAPAADVSLVHRTVIDPDGWYPVDIYVCASNGGGPWTCT